MTTKQKSAHTQTQQDTHFSQTDVNPDETAQSVGRQNDPGVYQNRDGAQTGTKRSPKTIPGSAHAHNTEQSDAAYEGSTDTRVLDDDSKQGVTTNSSSKEADGQRKVVGERPDAQAGVNHSGKTPR